MVAVLEAKIKDMATLCLINFPEFSESRDFENRTIRSMRWGGVLKVGLLNRPNLSICISISKKIDIDKPVERIMYII